METTKVVRRGDYQYTFNNDFKGWHVRVRDITKESYDPIPAEIDGFPVRSMGHGNWGGKGCKGTFIGCRNLKSVDMVIPDSVIDMENCFNGCVSLETVKIRLPENLIGATGMFCCCSKLKQFELIDWLPEKVKYANGMFEECSSLEKIPAGLYIPAGCTTVARMFMNCTSLQEIPDWFSLPEKIKANKIFGNCSFELIPVPLRKKSYFY